MAKEKQLKVYSITDLQQKTKKKDKSEQITSGQARLDDHVPIKMQHHPEGINEEFYALLQTNPFAYNYKTATQKAVSVEEFYISVKKETKPFGAIFRSSELSKAKKSKLIRRAFAKWKKDFTTNKQNVFQKENDKVFVVGEVVVSSVTIINIILIFLLMIILGSMAFQIGSVWDILANSPKAILQKMSLGITTAFNVSWVKLISQASFPVTIAALLYIFYHNSLIGDFKRTTKDSRAAYKKTSKEIEQDFKKKFKKTRNYYVRKTGSNPLKIAPLGIEKTATGGSDFTLISEISDSYVKKAAYLKKNRGKLNAFRFIFIFLVYATMLTPIGYALYSIVRQFI